MTSATFHHPLGHTGDMTADLGPNKLILKSFTRDESGQFKLALVVSRGPAETDPRWNVIVRQFHRYVARVSLVCPNGVGRQISGGTDQRDTYVKTDLQFAPRDPDDQPTDVKVELPSAFSEVTAKFQFKDVPMP
jgi:hypothetical protein